MNKFAMLWVYQQMRTSKSSLKVEAGQQPSLCFQGRKHMLCVAAGHPVRVLKRPAEDFPKMRAVMDGDGRAPYPVPQAIKKFRDIGSRCGITRAAELLLEKAEAAGTELDEDAFENEEDVIMASTEKTDSTTTAAEPAKETIVKKTKKTTKKAADKKPATVKPTKATASKKAANSDGLGREGSLTRFMNERLVKGQTNEEISTAAKKTFPKSSTTDPSHVSWYRWNATKKGLLKAAGK